MSFTFSDNGFPVNRVTRTVTINVVDNNDNAPMFERPYYEISLKENHPIDQIFLTLTATDKDSNALSYQLQNPTSIGDIVVIDHTNGSLFLNHSLDYEAQKTVIFSVLVFDKSGDRDEVSRFGTAMVKLIVQDVNDNAPRFSPEYLSNVTINVLPDEPKGSTVFILRASDVDTTSKDLMTFHLSDTTDNFPFQIGLESGVISLRRALTVEDPSDITFKASVTDEDNLSDSITILVRQVIGNTAPEFSADTYVFSVLENQSPAISTGQGQNQEMQVTATDRDSGPSGVLTYQIVSAEVDTPFSINNNTGQIVQLRVVDYEENPSFTFLVQAIDDGHPKRSASTLVKILIRNINEPPQFTQLRYNATISEATLPGQPIALLSYSDPDKTLKSDLTASVEGDLSNLFQVQPMTGALMLRQSLSFNDRSEYTINVTLKDNGEPPQAAQNTAQVIVRVTKAIVNGPTFNQSRYVFNVKENRPFVLGTLSVLSELNAHPVLGIVGEDAKLLFNLTDKGVLSVIGSGLDYETQRVHNFLVQVYEAISPQTTNRAIVTVHVEDVNDNKRIVSVDRINKTVSESTLAGTILSVFEVIDADSNDINQFAVALFPKQDHFAVLRTGFTVSLMLTKELDFEVEQRYQFLVEIIDELEQNKEMFPVSISVTDINEFRPVFENTTYSIEVAQNSPVDTTLLSILATDQDRSTNNLSPIKYTVIPSSDKIEVNLLTGEVVQTGSFLNNDRLHYQYTVIAKDGGVPALSSETTLTINVTPKNLNTPAFTKTFYQKDILENSMLGLTLLHLEAEDKDIVGKPLVYEIKTGNIGNHFNITRDGYLIIDKNIDRETFDSFNLTVGVRDSGSPPLIAETDAFVRIMVLDQNDQSPLFISQNKVDILETFPLDDPFLTVKATDADQGVFGDIQYLLQDAALLDRFSIGSSSGEVRLVERLKPQTITLYVTARDGGGNEGHQAVLLTIVDVNSPPVFAVTERSISLSESVEVGTTVFTFSATDPDENDDLSYGFTQDTDTFKQFVLENKNKLVVSTALDYETRSEYQLKVVSYDRLNATSSNVFTLSIAVQNKFFKPTFEKSLYEVEISESTPENTQVIQLNVTSESSVIFQIASESPPPQQQAESFTINQQTGKISLVRQLDFEAVDKHRLVVRAQSSPDTYSDAVVIITVTNINEFRPAFTNVVYEYSIRSPTYNNSIVGSVLAEDKDGGELGRISYQLINTADEPSLPFALNENHIVATSNILFGDKTKYTFDVRANDNGTPKLFSENDAKVIVNVIDNTDRVPYLQPIVIEKDLAEDTPAGTSLLQLKATDPDSGIYGQVTFSLDTSKDSATFSINPQTGDIILATTNNGTLDYTKQRRYVLVARVTDGVGLTSVGTVIFNIVDKNSHRPNFIQTDYKTTIADTMPVDTSIITVYADDNDIVTGHLIFYRILSGDDEKYFQIKGQTGEIFLNKKIEPDFNKTRFLLTIEAYNALSGGTELLSSEKATVRIDVLTQASLYTPKFEQSEYNTTIGEPGNLNVVQLQVAATIADERVSDTIRYAIQDSKYSDVFRIDPLTGNINLLKTVDRETKDQYIFTVIAGTTFHGQEDKATVIVSVSDANDNFPLPNNGVYQLSIDLNENLPIGFPIVAIEASDPDLGDNKRVQYTITSGNDNEFFEISGQDGVLRLKSEIDFETAPSSEYNLKVSLSDFGNPPRTNPEEMSIQVTLININDNVPVFVSLQYEVNIAESTLKDTAILEVNASDEDKDNVLVFSLEGKESAPFRINPLSGQISTNASDFNYNTHNKFCFLVKASDGKFTAYTNVIVRVTDVNNNDPVITNKDTEISIPEDLKLGSILEVIAYKDKDQGISGEVNITITSDSNIKEMFRIENTNQLVLAKELDFETTQSYTIHVQATDRGSPARQSPIKNFTVSVLNMNDNVPFVKASPQSAIDEGVYDSIEVAEIEVGDDDGTLNTLTVDLLENYSLFNIQKVSGGNKYKLLVTGTLNYEKRQEYQITIIVSDGEFKNVSSVQVNVLDVNERPVVTTTFYNLTVSEIAPVNTMVTRIQAYDPDTAGGANAKLTFKFEETPSPDTNNPFTINEDTGIIYLKSPLDFETKRRYDLEVSVSDLALIASPTTKLEINISPVNEHSPRIFTTSRVLSIDENESLNYQIFANDTDAQHSSNNVKCCSFSITFQSTPGLFVILEDADQPGLGTLQNTRTLDHEEIKLQLLTVEIQDGDSPSKVTFTDLQIHIDDVNDNAPVFGNDFPKSVTIPETYPVDTVVAIIQTSDADTGQNAQIDLSIVSGNTNNDFSIGQGNTLIIRNHLSYLRSSVYNLKIKASDRGSPALENETDFRIAVKQQNIHPPVFNEPVVSLSVDEGVYTDYKLYTSLATDRDGDTLVYNLLNEVPGIEVAKNGTVLLNGIFDVRLRQEYAIVVQASDGQLIATMVLLVKILDVNQSPVIGQTGLNISIVETTPVGSLISTIDAVDNDRDEKNRELVYQIVFGNDEDVAKTFRIDANNGQIYLEKELNFEDRREYEFSIKVFIGVLYSKFH